MKKRISWNNISAGDVVQFRYKGKSGKSRNRTCLILNERFMYKRVKDNKTVRLVHALQINAQPKSPKSTIIKESQYKAMFKKIGGLEIRDEETELERYAVSTVRPAAKQTYAQLSSLIKSKGIYRTFSWHVLKTRAAFVIDDFVWPDELVKQLQKTQPDLEEFE